MSYQQGRPKLVRSERNKIFAGVSAGIADHLGIDPLLVRIAFVVLTFINGAGLLVYLAAWLLMPKESSTRSVAEGALERLQGRDNRTWAWALGLGLVVALMILNIFPFDWDGGIVWALALVGGGVWLYLQDKQTRTGSPVSVPAGSSASPMGPLETARASEAVVATGPALPSVQTLPLRSPPTTAPARRVKHLRHRSNLGRYTFATILVVIGLVAALENLGRIEVTAGQYGGLMLTTIGLGLLVGTFWGRSRAMILLGLLVLPIFFATSIMTSWIDVPWRGGVGNRAYAPTSAGSISGPYELIAGRIDIDLTRLDFGDRPVELGATVVFGEINVLVPSGVSVDVRARAEAGVVRLFDQNRGGTGVELRSRDTGFGRPRLVLNLEAFIGEVEVVRSPEFLQELP
ncbi:MAG: PspC domain-containing protein [Actinomycetota bacterium]